MPPRLCVTVICQFFDCTIAGFARPIGPDNDSGMPTFMFMPIPPIPGQVKPGKSHTQRFLQLLSARRRDLDPQLGELRAQVRHARPHVGAERANLSYLFLDLYCRVRDAEPWVT